MTPSRKKRAESKPPTVRDDEKNTLLAFLDYLRDAVANKASGVPEPQVREPGVPRAPTSSAWSRI